MKTTKLIAACITALLITGTLQAQVPQLINYGGRVAVGTVNFDGSGQFKFAFVNADGSTTFWSNDGTSTGGSEPTAAVTLPVAKGLYSVLLGNATLPNMTIVPATVFTNADVRLRVWFSDGMSGFQLMTPDQRIAAVGYAMMAATAQTVPDGAITSAKIATGAVGGSQIAAGAVGSTQIAAGAVGSSQLAAGAVGSEQLAPGSIGFTQLAKPPQAGIYTVDPLATSLVTVNFPQPYAVAPVVTITRGASSTIINSDATLVSTTATGFTARVSGQPVTHILDIGQGGDKTSLATINGNPAISYNDTAEGDLKYVRATNASGTTWGTPLTVESAGNTGESSSLATVNGNPAISYFSQTNEDLKYVRANDASGTTWGTPLTVDSTGSVGRFTSLVIVNGNPAICYLDNTNQTVKYVRANDASGTTWGTPITVAGGETTPSLAIVNGNPAIVFYQNSTGNLKYVRANDASGTTWGAPITVATGSAVTAFCSLQVANGNPAISYFDGTNEDLMFVRASDASGTTWGTPITVDSTDNVGRATSLAIVGGNPAISYYDGTHGTLKYVRASDASGTAWGTPLTLSVVSEGNAGQNTSLRVVNGNPAVSDRQSSQKLVFFIIAGDLPLNWIALPQ